MKRSVKERGKRRLKQLVLDDSQSPYHNTDYTNCATTLIIGKRISNHWRLDISQELDDFQC